MNLVKTKNPLTWFPTLYFAMGLPLITISKVSSIMFVDLGVEEDLVAKMLSLVLLPWSFKPFFSVIMALFGTKRKYVVFTELLSAALFGAIIFAIDLPNFFRIIIALMAVIAICGSVHDIAGDGVYMEQLNLEDQKRYSGWQGVFYNIPKVLANGFLVFAVGFLTSKLGFSIELSWQIIIGIIAFMLFAAGGYHLFVMPKDKNVDNQIKATSQEKWGELKEIFIDFFRKKHIFYYIIFILSYRLLEGLTGNIVPYLLKRKISDGGLNMSNEEMGLIIGVFGSIAFMVGSAIVSKYITEKGLKKTLFSLALAFNIPFVVYWLFAVYQPQNIYLITAGIMFEYFGYGVGFVGLIVFMMQQVARGKYQMVHYAFANSFMNLSVVLAGFASGFLIKMLSYEQFFGIVMLSAVIPLLITWFLPFTYDDEKK